MRLLFVLSVLLCHFVTPARAQQSVQLEFREGRVWLTAHDAPVRAILSEWARIGGATIVNIDRVEGAPVTLEMVGVTEREALDIVLRGTVGYMIAARSERSDGASTFDRILILPTRTTIGPAAPANAAGVGPRTGRMPGPLAPPSSQAAAEPEEDSPDEDEDADDAPDPLTRLLRDGLPQVDIPPRVPIIGREALDDDAEPATTPARPSNVFGATSGTTTPGIVTPAAPGSKAAPATRVSDPDLDR